MVEMDERACRVAARSAASWSVRIEVMAADDETGAARLGRRDRPARAALQV